MRDRLATLVALSFLFTVSLAAQAPPLAGLDTYVEQAMRDWQVPGVAIAVVKGDKVVLAKGYGVRRVGSPERVDARTIFGVASNTKGFTGAALATLVDEGRLKWDDPVVGFLSDFQMHDPYVTRELRIRDLLAHRNGLAPYGGDIMAWGSSYPRKEVVRRIRFVKPVSSFRSRYAYQNGMYVTAGEVIEAVSGTTWDEFVRARVLLPLSMTSTSTSIKALGGFANVASPHIRVDGNVEPIPWRNLDNLAPAAGLNSNVTDMARWLRVQLGHGTLADGRRIFTRAAAHEMWSPQTVMPIEQPQDQLQPPANFMAYGLGWILRDYRGRKLVMHGGWTDGMLSGVALLPGEQVGVVVLTNLHNRNLTQPLIQRILDSFLDVPAEDWSAYFLEKAKLSEAAVDKQQRELAAARQPDTKPSLPLTDYAGTYRNDVYGDVTIAVEDEKLVIRFSASPTFIGTLEHWHYDVFRAKWRERIPEPALVTFTVSNDRKVTSFATTLGDFIDPATYSFERVRE